MFIVTLRLFGFNVKVGDAVQDFLGFDDGLVAVVVRLFGGR
jgi:hypothetical protein